MHTIILLTCVGLSMFVFPSWALEGPLQNLAGQLNELANAVPKSSVKSKQEQLDVLFEKDQLFELWYRGKEEALQKFIELRESGKVQDDDGVPLLHHTSEIKELLSLPAEKILEIYQSNRELADKIESIKTRLEHIAQTQLVGEERDKVRESIDSNHRAFIRRTMARNNLNDKFNNIVKLSVITPATDWLLLKMFRAIVIGETLLKRTDSEQSEDELKELERIEAFFSLPFEKQIKIAQQHIKT